ncbi:heparinase II/III family protein [uncultured Prochlorococcus sp.]|uniref:heparinase II/III domain-containing protein n=1 Tax=uncultured Prochlorococcus sp. TaxID=159733 RepID=UPI00258FD7C3|nr:heparinase II/III family protein [uncultured Prochlorococcus sp.]
MKIGYFQLFFPIKNCPIPEIFFNSKAKKKLFENDAENIKENCINHANKIVNGYFQWFNNKSYFVKFPPDWHQDPISGEKYPKGLHWSNENSYFNSDIKRIWELSRWSWLPLLARAAKYTDDTKFIDAINFLIKDWCINNQLNSSPNWICAQEVSIRMIHAFQSWQILEGGDMIPKKTKSRKDFIVMHLERILSTLDYALAQDNNHSISEAAALYIGGGWLGQKRFCDLGRRLLERNVYKLIMMDGSFSQYSTNYHRLVIDTLTQVEIFRKISGLEKFSEKFYKKFNLAIEWLFYFIDNESGEVPNLGGNDGAYCYKLNSLEYKNFKPSIQIANMLLNNQKIYKSGPWDEQFYWYESSRIFKKDISVINKKRDKFKFFHEGGYFVISPNKENWAILRLPNFKFRPSQSDVFHFDLWSKGKNILKDSGSYSYKQETDYSNYFSGIKGHNTVEIDEKEPMTKLGTFLWGDWSQNYQKPIVNKTKNFYEFKFINKYHGIIHKRNIKVSIDGNNWQIEDKVTGIKKVAILRWRLANFNWSMFENKLISERASLIIKSKNNLNSLKLSDGFESLFYDSKQTTPILEALFETNYLEVVTEVSLNNI